MLRAEVSDGDAVITLRGRRARAAVRVKDIAFTKRGFRRRCHNYFMGAARTRRGAPRCALKTLLLRAVITLWGRRTRAIMCRLHHYHTYSMQLHSEISFLRCICS